MHEDNDFLFHLELPAGPGDIVPARQLEIRGWVASRQKFDTMKVVAPGYEFAMDLCVRKDCIKVHSNYRIGTGFSALIDSAIIARGDSLRFDLVCFARSQEVARQAMEIPVPPELVGAPQFLRSRCMTLVTSPRNIQQLGDGKQVSVEAWVGCELEPSGATLHWQEMLLPMAVEDVQVPDPVRVRFHERYAVIRKLRAILPAEIDLKTECFAVEIEVHDNEGVIGREQTRIELQKPGAPEPMNCYSRSSSHDFLLLFHHLEKTAGTTIRHVIARQYEQDEIYYLYNGEPQFRGFEDFKLLSAEDQQRINVILGHNTRHAGSYLHRDYRAATFLRNPIDRLLSLYAFVKRHKETPLNRVLHEHKLGFTDFVTRIHELSGIGYAGVDNSLVRKISGVDARIGHCHEGMLEVAIDKVDREFAVVGLVERFDESLLMMRRAFGWRTPFYRKSNVSKNRKKRTELSDADMEKIRPYSELDIRLYEYCATRLQQQIDAAGESFAKELTEFQAANAYSANWLEE